MRNVIERCVFVLIAVALSTAPVHAQAPKRGDQNRITQLDIGEAGTSIVTAYDAVRLLRPNWLKPPLGRSASSNLLGQGGGATEIIVYVDDIRQPDLERSLSRVKGADVIEMKWLDQNKAVQDHGPGHELGAIEVTTIYKRK